MGQEEFLFGKVSEKEGDEVVAGSVGRLVSCPANANSVWCWLLRGRVVAKEVDVDIVGDGVG